MKRSFRWWWFLLLPVAPVLLPLYLIAIIIFVLPMGYAGCELFRQRRRWLLLRDMRRANRVIPWSEIEQVLAKGSGTLIIDCPTVGWNDGDVWWTPESVPSVATTVGILATPLFAARNPTDLEKRMHTPTFDRWCIERYLVRSTGTAKLVQSTLTQRACRKTGNRLEVLQAKHAQLEIVECLSWIVTHSDEAARREKKSGSRNRP